VSWAAVPPLLRWLPRARRTVGPCRPLAPRTGPWPPAVRPEVDTNAGVTVEPVGVTRTHATRNQTQALSHGNVPFPQSTLSSVSSGEPDRERSLVGSHRQRSSSCAEPGSFCKIRQQREVLWDRGRASTHSSEPTASVCVVLRLLHCNKDNNQEEKKYHLFWKKRPCVCVAGYQSNATSALQKKKAVHKH